MKIKTYDIVVGNWSVKTIPSENGLFIFNTEEIQDMAKRDEPLHVSGYEDACRGVIGSKCCCPSCGYDIERQNEVFPNFCGYCGQRIMLNGK